MLLALGVVYGDIGTSPLYALRECFKAEYGLTADADTVYGVLSLIVWSLVLVVSIKYVVFILRADNRGEGGILVLLALIMQKHRRKGDNTRRAIVISLGLIGAALLYGDGIITPAISVLGATEGLEVVTPALKPLVVPLTLIILITLFMFQSKGTAKVGRVFGPVMLVWFLSIAVLGAAEIALAPEVLFALNPWYGLRFFIEHGFHGFVLMGAVVLAITGGEALYADMGHFGRRPIRLAWFAMVLPALLLNYFGQGALILRDPQTATNPFFLLAPRILVYPLVALATAAAIIASQALISGAFSLTQQAVQLGYSPRASIIHTSKTEHGQIYVPEVRNALLVGSVLVVLGFRSVSALSAAYGIAVTGTMAITTLLFYILARSRWHWSIARAGSFLVFFLLIDLTFFASNAIKIASGGWVPLLLAAMLFLLMTTWNRGRRIVQKLLIRGSLPMDLFMPDVARKKPPRVPGTAVFLTSDPEGAPLVLLHHLKHIKMLHEKVILLSVLSTTVPEVPEENRVEVIELGEGFYRVRAKYGFMETPNVPEVLERAKEFGLMTQPATTSYFLGRERLLPSGNQKLARWRKKLFIFMSRNSRTATEFFGLPPNRVVELGAQIEF
jgi:KUP system potassium uptake protein